MKEYLILGDIGFAMLTSPVSLAHRQTIDFAEHPVIEKKTLLQYTGEPAVDMELSFTFHADYCSPQAVWDRLTALADSHRAFDVLTGAGRILGQFVLTELNRTTTWAADDGTLFAFDCDLRLKEFVQTDALSGEKRAGRSAALAVVSPGRRAPRPVRRPVTQTAPAVQVDMTVSAAANMITRMGAP